MKVSNKVWNIGTDKLDRCHSCDGKSGMRVGFKDGRSGVEYHLKAARINTSIHKRRSEETTTTTVDDVKHKPSDMTDVCDVDMDVSQLWVQVTPIKESTLVQLASSSSKTKPQSSLSSSSRSSRSTSKSSVRRGVKKSAKNQSTHLSPGRSVTVRGCQSCHLSSPKSGQLLSSPAALVSPLLLKKNSKGETPMQIATIKVVHHFTFLM